MEDTTSGGAKPQNTSPKSEQPSTTPQKLELPKGRGAIREISESFRANSFTGSGSFSIPIPIPSCRNFSPTLSIDYSSGSGNGVFGIGFNISIASIIRKISKKVPTYNDEDIFVLTGVDDLVPTYQSSSNEYDITYYQPRVESLFAKIERRASKSDHKVYWQVISKDGRIAIYGKDKQAQIYDPNNNQHIAEWLLESLSDVYGNKISYHYRPGSIEQGSGKVIDRITYGHNKELNYDHFEVLFDYGKNDFANPIDKKYGDTREAILRLDPFTSHITGFAIRTELLCRAIRIYHRFDELGRESILVNGTYFDYDEKPTITYLRAVKQVGYYERENKRFTKATPTLVLSYTSEDLTYISTVSSVALTNGNKPSKELLQILKEQDFVFSEKDSEITKENSAWKVVEKEKTLLVKEKGNFLDLHNPNNKSSFKPVKIKGSSSFPGYLSEQKFQSVDLYQEGIEGIFIY